MLISSRFSRAGVRTVGYRGVFVYLHSFTPVNESACFSKESPCSSNKTQFPPTATLMTVITPPSQKNQRRNYNNLRTVAPLCVCACVCVCVCAYTVAQVIHDPWQGVRGKPVGSVCFTGRGAMKILMDIRLKLTCFNARIKISRH